MESFCVLIFCGYSAYELGHRIVQKDETVLSR